MRCYYSSKSTSTATTTSVSVSAGSQPESSVERHQQGSFVGLSTAVHTPDSKYIPAAEPYAWLRLADEISASQLQIDPFEELATYQTVSLYDDAQELSAGFLSLPYEPLLSNEPSPASDDANPIMKFEEPKPRSSQTLVDQDADSTDKWIIYNSDETKPFKCGYEGCGKTYTKKHSLRRHFPKHTGDSQFRCYTGDCTGKISYCDEKTLTRHIYKKHVMERPYECNICNKRFLRSDTLLYHRTNVHSTRDEQNQPQNSDSTDNWVIYSGNETRPFQCGYEGCGKAYTTKQALQRHFPAHTGDSQFRCYTGDCTGATSYCDEKTLTRHIHKKHVMERPYECDICNKRFFRSHTLLCHRTYVHSARDEQNQPQNSESTDKWIIYSGNETRPFQCGYEGCGKTYTTKQALQRHFPAHTGDSQFRRHTGDCTGATSYCDKRAPARHINKKHTMKRPYTCEFCNSQFLRADHLNQHQQSNICILQKKRKPRKKSKNYH